MLKNFTMPKKYSYLKKPITVTAEVDMTGERLTRKLKEKIINRATELTGIVPFNWTKMWGHFFVAFFGFGTMESALAAQARLQDSNFYSRLWDEDVEEQVVGNFARQAEADAYEIDGYQAHLYWEPGASPSAADFALENRIVTQALYETDRDGVSRPVDL
jgi:hypothetical protein